MYEYTFLTSEITGIRIPSCKDLKNAKKELLEQTSTYAKNKITFPSGLIFEYATYADKIEIRCNKPIQVNNDGTAIVLE